MHRSLVTLAITGNVLFILWLTFNGMDEGWHGTPLMIVSYIGLTLLLILNSVLLYRQMEKVAKLNHPDLR